MTREHKLALIIGFSLVLLIGVLISDHFSRAGAMEIAGISEGEGRIAPTVLPLTREDLGPVLDRNRPAPATETVANTAGPNPGDTTPPAEPSGLNISKDQLLARLEEEGWLRPTGLDEVGPTEPAPQVPLPRPEEPAPERAAPEAPAAPAFADHTVKNGESLFQIASRHLGDGGRWREIRDANPKSVGKDGSVRAGVRLRIPLGGAISDPLIQPPNAREQPASKPPAKAPSKAKPDAGRAYTTYTVRPGDSLGEIAVRTLGTAKRMGEIAALNRLSDANSIRVGVVLKIPPG